MALSKNVTTKLSKYTAKRNGERTLPCYIKHVIGSMRSSYAPVIDCVLTALTLHGYLLPKLRVFFLLSLVVNLCNIQLSESHLVDVSVSDDEVTETTKISKMMRVFLPQCMHPPCVFPPLTVQPRTQKGRQEVQTRS